MTELPEAKQLNHLGIIAGVCKDVGLIDIINKLIKKDEREVSVGAAIQALILNATGFSNKALYLTKEFYRNRPIDLLIQEGITADQLNDDCFGRTLDACYEYGVTELFYGISSHILEKRGIASNFVHLDSTSFSLHGRCYEEDPEELVTITKGYSKDNNPDLPQVVLSMVCSYKSTIPVWIEILSGNSSDKTSFRETIKKFTNELQGKKEQWYVADSELYTEKNISELSEVSWVTRVPERIKEAKDTISELNHDELQDSNLEGYKYKQITSHYGGIKQRWLVVYSEKAFLREKETFDKNLVKQCEKAQKELWHLSKKDFACEADAEKAAKEIIRKWKFHTSEVVIVKKGVYKSKGRPSKASAPEKYVWNVAGKVVEDEKAIQTALKQKGTFILGTNILDETKLTAEQLLDVYKSQNISVERGFRFLKDPLFYAESLYLKSTKRIMALIMVMCLSLLIYSLAEKELRDGLAANKVSVKNQVGKPTLTLTARRAFQMFQDIILLKVENNHYAMNLTDDHKTVLRAFNAHVQKCYFLT